MIELAPELIKYNPTHYYCPQYRASKGCQAIPLYEQWSLRHFLPQLDSAFLAEDPDRLSNNGRLLRLLFAYQLLDLQLYVRGWRLDGLAVKFRKLRIVYQSKCIGEKRYRVAVR